MGYEISVDCQVKIPVKLTKQVKKIFKMLEEKSPKGYHWVNPGYSKFKTVEEMFQEWRYEVESDDEYYTVNCFIGQKLGQDQTLWQALAPVITPDSVLYFTGEDDAHWKYTFKNNQFKESWGSVEYEDEKEEPKAKEEPVKPSKKTTKTPYEVLGVSQKATKAEIEKAYKEKMKSYHPDKFNSLDEDFIKLATEKSQELSQAKEKALKNLK